MNQRRRKFFKYLTFFEFLYILFEFEILIKSSLDFRALCSSLCRQKQMEDIKFIEDINFSLTITLKICL